MRFPTLRLLPLVLLAACSDHHPLAGAWNQELPNDAHGMHIAFDPKSDRLEVGLAPRADGTHDHLEGTYTFDAATKTVTVKARLMGDGKADTWTGKLAGVEIELSSADGKLTFHHGEHAHGH
jgi:polyisoprenoid-binding protein YceI